MLEVFVIASQAQSGVGCAFVRMGSLDAAENAVKDLHEQRVLIPEQRDLGPMQVAFAKGEAVRLGVNEKEEILPSFREARQKVVEHQEKKNFFEAMSKHQEIQQQAMQYQQAVAQQQQMMAQQAMQLSKDDLVTMIKDGQRMGGPPFKQKWWSFCDQGWGGTRDHDPSRHNQETLANFVQVASFEYGIETWFRKHFDDLPELPPAPPIMPTMPPGMPGGEGGGKGGGPPMPPPGFPPGPPGAMPPMMPGFPPFPPMPPPPGMGGKGGPPFPPPGMPPFGGPPMNGQDGGRPPYGYGHGGGRGGGGGGGRPPPPPQAPRGEAKKREESSDESSSEAGAIEDINLDDI